MADIVTFDGDNLRIVEIAAGAENELDVIEIYSEWKEWLATNSNAAYPPAFETVGGDPISPTQDLGTTYFLINGWKIRPAELDHKLILVGNIFPEGGEGSVFVSTLGAFTVNTETRVSNLVDSSIARLDLTQLLQEVYIDPINGTSGTGESVGTPTNPVDNVTDARTIADRDNLQAYAIRGAITITADHENWSFRGISAVFGDIITLNGASVDGSKFEEMTITGTMTGEIEANYCLIEILTGLDGMYRHCGLDDSNLVTASDVELVFDTCYSKVAGSLTPILGLAANTVVNIRNYSGGITLEDATAGNIVSVDLDPGHLILDASCTGGTILVRGTGRLTDNSAGSTIVDDGLLNTVEIDTMIQSTVGNVDVAGNDLKVTVLNKDLTTNRELSVSADQRTRRIL